VDSGISARRRHVSGGMETAPGTEPGACEPAP
jgi:hypothetical protein